MSLFNIDRDATAADLDGATGGTVIGPGRDSVLITKIPGPDSPLVFKIIPIPRPNKQFEACWRIMTHPHLVGDGDPSNKKNYRSHLCQRTLGRDSCPECDKYYELKEQLYALDKQGQKGSTDYMRIEARSKLFEPKPRGYCYVYLPDNPQVKVLRVGVDVMNNLWGKKANRFKAATESLVINMTTKDEVDPYNRNTNTGWINLSKTGENRDTKYTVSAAKTQQVIKLPSGKDTIATVPAEYNVHPAIKALTAKDLPDLGKFEERGQWTFEESKFYVDNLRPAPSVLSKNDGEHEDAALPLSGNGVSDVSPMEIPEAFSDAGQAADSLL